VRGTPDAAMNRRYRFEHFPVLNASHIKGRMFENIPILIAVIALAVGFLSGTGLARSFQLTHNLILIALAVQTVGWTTAFVVAFVNSVGWTPEWQIALTVGFFLSMAVVFPFTIIGAGIGGSFVWAAGRVAGSLSRR
jgi:hypothetical protein